MSVLRLRPSRFVLSLVAAWLLFAAAAARGADMLPLSEIRAGQEGVVWTVFSGTQPEPFKVRVVGVLENALGPKRSLIVCELTDPRVQSMGAAAGMSGSPLYIDGRFAGALSYQIQHFETVHFAGFTPAADLEQVADATSTTPPGTVAGGPLAPQGSFEAVRPVFSFGGLSPEVAALMAGPFAELGIALGAPTGGKSGAEASHEAAAGLRPGSPIAAALCVGDITLGASGTISMVDGSRITAFGHPMLGLGRTEIPFCTADILTILPSTMSSYKLANIGGVIGTLEQDRLSGVSGEIGRMPRMIDVELAFHPEGGGAPRMLHFQVARNAVLTPMIMASAVLQSLMGSNDSGQSEGFRLTGSVHYEGHRPVPMDLIYPGPQAFVLGLRDFAMRFGSMLFNPYENAYPDTVRLDVTAFAHSPIAVVNQFQLSRSEARPGETVVASLGWRDYQGSEQRESVEFKVDPAWVGKTLEVVLVTGPALDDMTGKPRVAAASLFRSFDAYLAAVSDDRRPDGVYFAVLDKAGLFSDQGVTTPELPGSLERIARGADDARFQHVDAYAPLIERHLIPGLLAPVAIRRTLRIVD